MTDQARDPGIDYATEAARVAGRLNPGSYESVQSLALVSIAHSLVRIAAALEDR